MAIEFAKSLSGTYAVRKDDQIRLLVAIGSGQPGVISLYMGGMLLNSQPIIIEQPLGSGSSLVGKTLLCIATVNDVRKETNLTNVRYVLTGAQKPLADEHELTVTTHGNSAIFTAEFTFEGKKS